LVNEAYEDPTMRNSHLAIILGVWLAVAACSKPTQD
jgi:hypothetical protein